LLGPGFRSSDLQAFACQKCAYLASRSTISALSRILDLTSAIVCRPLFHRGSCRRSRTVGESGRFLARKPPDPFNPVNADPFVTRIGKAPETK
jgi:hypothetical protein